MSTSTLSVPAVRPSLGRTVSASSTKSLTSAPLSLTLSRQKDKPRLYLALFPRGGITSTYSSRSNCDSYHWALVVGPKTPSRKDAGMAYHLVHDTSSSRQSYVYEETDLNDTPHQARAILVRITLAKILDQARFEDILRSIKPDITSHRLPHSSNTVEDDELDASYTCLDFVRQAYEQLTSSINKFQNKNLLKSYIGPDDWTGIETCARRYVKQKRSQGRFQLSDANHWDPNTVPTWNFWENRETTE